MSASNKSRRRIQPQLVSDDASSSPSSSLPLARTVSAASTLSSSSSARRPSRTSSCTHIKAKQETPDEQKESASAVKLEDDDADEEEEDVDAKSNKSKSTTSSSSSAAARPNELLHPSHPHPLRLIKTMNLICDVCEKGSYHRTVQTYHCRQLCDFDMCMTCATKHIKKSEKAALATLKATQRAQSAAQPKSPVVKQESIAQAENKKASTKQKAAAKAVVKPEEEEEAKQEVEAQESSNENDGEAEEDEKDEEEAEDEEAEDEDDEEEEKDLDANAEIDLEAESDGEEDDDDEEMEDSQDAAQNQAAAAAASSSSDSKTPLVPFIFNAGPSEAEREASQLIVQNRLKQFLDGAETIGKTSHAQRMRMTKDRLLQRNIEIQASQFYLDRNYDDLLNSKPVGWENGVATLDLANDEFAEESDEIETILFEKFRVVGGGRSLLSDEVRAAGEVGAAMADRHRIRGMPIPQLTPAAASNSDAAAASSNAATPAAAESLTTNLLVRSNKASNSSTAPAAASIIPSAASTVPAATPIPVLLTHPSTSKSDAAVKERLDAAQQATRERRAARAEAAKDSVLGKYMEYFQQFVDVDREMPGKKTFPLQRRKPQTPASFPLLLGTLVFPLFTNMDEIRVQVSDENENEAQEEEDEKPAESAQPSSSSPAAAAASSSGSRGTKRRRNDETEEKEEKEEKGNSLEAIDEDGESQADEEVAGEDCWLDFTFDPGFHDGCIVKQSVESSAAIENESTDVMIGLLPFEGLHPPQPDEPEPEYDEDGELIPHKPLPRPMPTPSHALPALYILHEANVVRLESALIRHHASQDVDEQADTRDRVEVTILVNSKIFDKQLLRSIAQKQALLTLFRLFSLADPTEAIVPKIERALSVNAPKPLYENAKGELVEYNSLTEEERRVIALKKTTQEIEEEHNQQLQIANKNDSNLNGERDQSSSAMDVVVKQEESWNGPIPMEIDGEEQKQPQATVVQTTETAPSLESSPSLSPAAVAAASVAAAASVSSGNKRRKVDSSPAKSSTLALGLVDRTIDGDDIGVSGDENDDDDDEGEDDEDESLNSEDDLFETLDENHHVFVDLFLPSTAEEQTEPGQTAASTTASPEVSPEDAGNPSAENVVTEEEKSMLRQLERNAVDLEKKDASTESAGKTTPAVELSSEAAAEAAELEAENTASWRPDTLQALFESLRPAADSPSISQPVQLISTLRPFQAKALAWMVDREARADKRSFVDPLWEAVQLNGRTVYYHAISGILQKAEPELIKDVRGGILADEMGLGKTLVVIALVLKRPWIESPMIMRKRSLSLYDSGELVYSGLYDAEPRLKLIRATLIVSPMSLSYQWEKEIRLHAPSLRVLIYDGSNAGKSSSSASTATDRSYRAFRETMERFAEYDVILTNYSVLASEVNYSKACTYQFRSRKQYGVPKSPLLDSHFHRVILDEAQQVHSSLSVCFKMASRLSASSKFCVSGTPIGPQGLHDLFGLVSFLGVQPFSNLATWRAAMRTSTPEGMERLRSLLKQIMWRHSKQHVIDEVGIPRLHLNKVYLTFSKVESEYYKRLEYECSSHVFFEEMKGRLEDRTAMKKLESLRIACAHPQASSGTFLGKQVKSMADIGKALIKRSKDDQLVCERDLCRAINRLALHYHQQGEWNLAETTFINAWKISDKGVAEDLQDQLANPDPSAAAKSNADEAFDTDVNLVTANTQIRQWRVIELVTSYRLAQIYARKLDTDFNRKVDANICTWNESVEDVFQSLKDESMKYVNLYASFSDVHLAQGAVIDCMDRSTKPVSNVKALQGMSALSAARAGLPAAAATAAASASAAAASSASMNVDASHMSEEEALYQKHLRQRDHVDICLHDLLDAHEYRLNEAAVLHFLTYEVNLLPKWVALGSERVKELYDVRNRMGIEEFNRDPALQSDLEELTVLSKEEEELYNNVVLSLYDLTRSKNHIELLLLKLTDTERQASLNKVHAELRLAVKRKRKSYYPHAPPKPILTKTGREKTFDERLRKQLGLIQGAITKRMKQLTSDLRSQLQRENDLDHMENDQRQFHSSYHDAWLRAYYSVAALKIMSQMKHDRILLRIRIKKMLDSKVKLLLDQGIITQEDADKAAERHMLQPGDLEEAEAVERQAMRSSPKKKSKKQKEEEADGDEMDVTEEELAAIEQAQSSFASSAAAAASASAASSGIDSSLTPAVAAAAAARARASAFNSDQDMALSRELINEGAVRKYQREITRLQTTARSLQGNVNWLKTQFGLMSANDPSIRGLCCSICSNEVSIPALTVCGHYFDFPCLNKWLTKSNSCPTCRKQLGPDDYAAFNKEELPKPKEYAADQMNEDEEMKEGEKDQSNSGSLGRSMSLTATAPASSSSVSASAPIAVPPIDVMLRMRIHGEGKYGSKVETIVKYIRFLHQKDPSIKVLVFSQYHRMLDMVWQALSENQLSSLHLTGTPSQRAKQIDTFQTDSTYTAFLMSLRNDNSGLTLVSATAVFLMEPSLNPAIEAQAINRISRIGQTKETQAFKFIMRNSVEQAIEELSAAGRGDELLATSGAVLNTQSKESLSVGQLLRVLNLSDDKKPADDEEAALVPDEEEKKEEEADANLN